MNERLAEAIRRRAALVAQAAVQRNEIGRWVQPWQLPLGLVDRGDRTGASRAHESACPRHWRAAVVSSGVWALERVGRALVDGLADIPIAARPAIATTRLSRTRFPYYPRKNGFSRR